MGAPESTQVAIVTATTVVVPLLHLLLTVMCPAKTHSLRHHASTPLQIR